MVISSNGLLLPKNTRNNNGRIIGRRNENRGKYLGVRGSSPLLICLHNGN